MAWWMYALLPWILFGWSTLLWVWWPRQRSQVRPFLVMVILGIGFWGGLGWLGGGLPGARVGLLVIGGLMGMLSPFAWGRTFVYGLRHHLGPDAAMAALQAHDAAFQGLTPRQSRWVGRTVIAGIIALLTGWWYLEYRDEGTEFFRYNRAEDTLSLLDAQGNLLRIVPHPCPDREGSFWNSSKVNTWCEVFREREESRELLIRACERAGIPLDERCTWEAVRPRRRRPSSPCSPGAGEACS